MKNPDPTGIVTAALKKVLAAKSEIEHLQTLAADTKAELTTLELSVALDDAAGLAKIGRLHTLDTLIPRRFDNREREMASSLADLLNRCHEFISDSLSPRMSALLKLARAKVSADLKPHFPEEILLNQAVESSAMVVELNNLHHQATIYSYNPNDLPKITSYAESLVEIWKKAAAFEKAKLA